eukprot:scaffold24837_cov105-Isochrysis_galbana.AAC.4
MWEGLTQGRVSTLAQQQVGSQRGAIEWRSGASGSFHSREQRRVGGGGGYEAFLFFLEMTQRDGMRKHRRPRALQTLPSSSLHFRRQNAPAQHCELNT